MGRPEKAPFHPPSAFSFIVRTTSSPRLRLTVTSPAAGPTHFFSTGTFTVAVEVLVTVKPFSASPVTAES